MIKKPWELEQKFRKKNQKTENGDIWRPGKIKYKVFLGGYQNNHPMKSVIRTFPCIDNAEYENAVEKRQYGRKPK